MVRIMLRARISCGVEKRRAWYDESGMERIHRNCGNVEFTIHRTGPKTVAPKPRPGIYAAFLQ
jgi:hypothetical protein